VEPKTVLLLLAENGDVDTVLLHKRPTTGLLSGLWEFPCLDGHLRAEQAADAAARMLPGLAVRTICEAPDAVHIFTHVEWHMRAYTLRCDAIPLVAGDNAYALATPAELADRYAIPSAFRAYLAYLTGSTKKTNE
jgi:A/G-specific adenine glycosylase